MALTNVFISYKRGGGEEELAKRLERYLDDQKVKVWRDKNNIRVGSHWPKAVAQAIKNCAECVVILSPESLDSKMVEVEWHRALKLNKRVIPLVYEECEIPLPLDDPLQRVVYSNDDRTFRELMDLTPPPESWIDKIRRFFRQTRIGGLAAIFAIALASALFWFLAPSQTSLTVSGVTPGPRPAIVVHATNRGGRPSTADADWALEFPDLPIKQQNLRFAKGTARAIRGHDVTELQLTASGLEPIVSANGSYLDGETAVQRLTGHEAVLHYQVAESSGEVIVGTTQFHAETIREFIRRMLPAPYPGASP